MTVALRDFSIQMARERKNSPQARDLQCARSAAPFNAHRALYETPCAAHRLSVISITATLAAMYPRTWPKLGLLWMCLSAVALPSIGADSDAPRTAQGAQATGCLASGTGFLRARIRGAFNLDVDWKNAELECDGSERPDGHGIRLSFAGPKRSNGRRLRIVFGVATAREGAAGRALPTNLTVILEGEQRLFATRGEDRCTVDDLKEERFAAPGSDMRFYRVVARGFCTGPAMALDRDEHILVSRFDFAGRVSFANPTSQTRIEHPL